MVPTRSLESAVVVVIAVARSSPSVITFNIANPCSANVDMSCQVIDVSVVVFVRCCLQSSGGTRWMVHGQCYFWEARPYTPKPGGRVRLRQQLKQRKIVVVTRQKPYFNTDNII